MNQAAFPNIKRRYFEAFGDLETEILFLRRFSFSLLSLVFALGCFVYLVGKKPPVVIRVSEVAGAEAIEDLKENNAPTAFEMVGFAKRFTLRYTGYNSYTVSRDFSEALNQMTLRFQREVKKQMLDSGLIAKIAQAGVNTEVEFKDQKLERDTPDAAVISVVGLRRMTKYGVEDFDEKTLFRADLVLKKVARSRDVPEGLLVDQYREILLNELTERK